MIAYIFESNNFFLFYNLLLIVDLDEVTEGGDVLIEDLVLLFFSLDFWVVQK